MIYVGSSNPFEAVLEAGITGLVGTLAVEIVDNDGNIVAGPTTANIAEEATTGVYMWNNAAAPSTLGQYTIIWSVDGTFDEATVAAENLVVVQAAEGPLPPIPPPAGGGLSFGPCTSWITGDDVAACCGVEASSSAMFDDAADQASQLLFELSARQFAGLCSRTVRPACDSCYCGYQILSRGYVIGPWDYGYPLLSFCDQCMIACAPSMVKLAGYPIREITAVKIDGDTVDPSLYTIWNNRYLSRLDNGHWPWTQNLTLPDTDDHTFSIEYTYGQSPPLTGQAAAAQLACELYKACAGDGNDCALPLGTTRLVRQGVTIDKLSFISWAFRDRRWQTGLPLVDAFLSAYNPSGIKRRPTIWAPGKRQYAQPYG